MMPPSPRRVGAGAAGTAVFVSVPDGPAAECGAGTAGAAAGLPHPSGGTASARRRSGGAGSIRPCKSMIIKTADTVQRRMDQLSAQAGRGSMWRRRNSAAMWRSSMRYLEATSGGADAVLQLLLQTCRPARRRWPRPLNSTRLETEGYIRTGIVCYDGAVPAVRRGGGAEPDLPGSGRRRRWWSRTTSGRPSLPARLSFWQDSQRRWRMCPTTGCISPTSRCWRA